MLAPSLLHYLSPSFVGHAVYTLINMSQHQTQGKSYTLHIDIKIIRPFCLQFSLVLYPDDVLGKFSSMFVFSVRVNEQYGNRKQERQMKGSKHSAGDLCVAQVTEKRQVSGRREGGTGGERGPSLLPETVVKNRDRLNHCLPEHLAKCYLVFHTTSDSKEEEEEEADIKTENKQEGKI